MPADHITKIQAQIIIESMPDGATHFWTKNSISPFSEGVPGNGKLKMRFFEKWTKVPAETFLEYDSKTNSWKRRDSSDGTNVNINDRTLLSEIKKIAYPEYNSDELDLEDAIKFVKSKGYVVAKIV